MTESDRRCIARCRLLLDELERISHLDTSGGILAMVRKAWSAHIRQRAIFREIDAMRSQIETDEALREIARLLTAETRKDAA